VTDWLGWHFLPYDGRLANGDGRDVRIGETLRVEGPLELCKHGLHASRRALDALKYAPGALACRVKLSGKIVEDDDKACATERTVLGMVDATRLLHEFACDVAEQALRRANVTDERSWNAIWTKRRWLDGEASYAELAIARVAAEGATRNGVWVATCAAVRSAAQSVAARDVAWNTAWHVAWYATSGATSGAAWDELNARLEKRLLTALEEVTVG